MGHAAQEGDRQLVKPPLCYRLLNAIRAWCERDDRLLVEQWKDAFKPEPRKVRHLNLRIVRDQRRRVA